MQVALALDELDSMTSQLDEASQEVVNSYESQIERLLRSAMRAMRAGLGADFKSVEAIMDVYSSGLQRGWLDQVETWAKEGRQYRESKPDRPPQG